MVSNIKQLILGILTIAVGVFGWFILNAILVKGASFSEIGIFSAFFLIALGILFSFCALFIKRKAWIFILLAILAILPFLVFKKNYYFLGASVLFFLTLVLATRFIQKEQKIRLRFSFSGIVRRGLPMFLTGFSLMLSTMFVFSPQVSKIAIEIPQPLFDSFFGTFSKIIDWQFYPGFYPEITVDEFLTLFLSEQIETLKESSEYAMLPPKLAERELQKMQTKLLEEQRQKLSKNLEIEISGKEKVKDILYQVVNKNLPSLIKPYQEFLPSAFILLSFMVIKPLTWPLMWIMVFLGWLLLKILIFIKIVSVKKEKVEKEIMTL